MSRVSELTHNEVFGAISALLADGIYPTGQRVREHLRNRGSPVVLQRFLSEWYAEFGPSLAENAAASNQRPATAGLRSELERLTQGAIQEFEDEKAARTAKMDERTTRLDAFEAALFTKETQLADREFVQRELIDHLRSELQGAQAKERDATASHAGIEALLRAANEQAATQATQIQQLEDEAREHVGTSAALAGALQTLEAQQLHIAALTEQRDALQGDRDRLSSRVESCRDELSALDEQYQEARVVLAGAQERLVASTAQADQLLQALSTEKDRLATHTATSSSREGALVAQLTEEQAARKEAELKAAELITHSTRQDAILMERQAEIDRLISVSLGQEASLDALADGIDSLRDALKAASKEGASTQ